MDKSSVLVSICIPTYKRGMILEKTLESIYSQLDKSNFDKVEVIVTDNDPDHENELHISKFIEYDNFHYHKNKSKGFLNSLEALKMGKGTLLKLHNVQMLFKQQSINSILRTVEVYKTDKPTLFFSNGVLKSNSTRRLQSFDDFILALSYQCSWSAGYSLWRKDINIISQKCLDKTFPQTSLLFALNNKAYYIIDDSYYCSMQFVKGKGGYNIFKVFGYDFLDMISTYANSDIIKIRTFEKIRKDLAVYFFPKVIFKNLIFKVERFQTKGFIKYLDRHYSRVCIFVMFVRSLTLFKIYLKDKLR